MDSGAAHLAQITATGATAGILTMFAGEWEGFVLLGAVGGIVGHLIWVERFPAVADSMPTRAHLLKVARNCTVSGFLGMMIYLAVKNFQLERSTLAYMFTGIAGMASIDFALIFVSMAKNALQGWARQTLGKPNDEDPKP